MQRLTSFFQCINYLVQEQKHCFPVLGDQLHTSIITSKNILVFVVACRDTYTSVIPGAQKITHFLLLTDSIASAPLHLAKLMQPFALAQID